MYSKHLDFPYSGKIVLIFLLFTIVISSCLTPSMVVIKEQQFGDDQFNNFAYEDAIGHYTKMLEASKNLGVYRNLGTEADVNRKMADAYAMTGDYESAFNRLKIASYLDSLENNYLGMIDNTIKTGRIYLYMGDFKKGIEVLEKASGLSDNLDQSLKSVNRLRAAEIFLTLGQYHAILGNLNLGLAYTMKAKDIFVEINNTDGIIEAYLNLARIFMDKGQPENAETMTRISLKKAEAIERSPVLQYRMLGIIKAMNGEYETSVNFHTKAVELANQTQILAQQIWTMLGLADILFEIGQNEDALEWLQKAKGLSVEKELNAKSLEASLNLRTGNSSEAGEYFSSIGATTGQAIAGLKAGEYYLSLQNYDSSILFLNESRRLFLSTGNEYGAGKTEIQLARLHIKKSNIDSARFYLEATSGKNDYPDIMWQNHYYSGQLYEIGNELENAIEAYSEAVKIIEGIRGNFKVDEYKSSFINDKQEVYDHLIRLLLKQGRSEESFLYSERARARAFLDQIANRDIDFSKQQGNELVLQEKEKRFELQKLNKMLIQNPSQQNSGSESREISLEQIRGELHRVQSEYADLLTRLKLSDTRYYSMVSVDPVSLFDLSENLDEKSCLLEYWVSENEILIWLITKEGISQKSIAVSNSSLESNIQLARRYIASNSTSRMTPILKLLYNTLILPFELELSNYSNWIIVPKGSLHFLPFQALIDGNDQYIVDKANISYAPSASILEYCRKNEFYPETTFLGMGLGNLSIGNNSSLPSTLDEVETISALFKKPKTFYEEFASESAFKNEAGGYGVLHLASHGFVDYLMPLFSYILLAPTDDDDGKLFLLEIMEMKLNADLVTLSACQTGLGNISEGDEIESLSRSFIYAGSSAVISSLWSVADYPTSVLMNNFYKIANQYPINRALTEAQRIVKKDFPSPFYWAPFVLNGDGTVRLKE